MAPLVNRTSGVLFFLPLARFLSTHLTSPSLQADGALGPLTRAAIRQFQLSRHLQPDGIVGPLTRAELRKALAELPP
jgi:peptidoglycan hydrolase-like protein with peptidoglycan-binding domain